jgi:hypothetical protein
MSSSEEKLPPPQYMERVVQRIRDCYGLPGSGQKEWKATTLNFLSFSSSDVLQNPEAQSRLIDLLADVIAAGRRDVFFAVLLKCMDESDSTWAQHPIARILHTSPSCKKEFREKVLDKLPSAWREELEEYRYTTYRETEWSSRLTEWGIFAGELMSTS